MSEQKQAQTEPNMPTQTVQTPHLENAGETNIPRRNRQGKVWRTVFMASTVAGIIVLTLLILNITNQSLGYMALEYKVQPESLSQGGTPLAELPGETLIQILQDNLTKNRFRTLDSQTPLAATLAGRAGKPGV